MIHLCLAGGSRSRSAPPDSARECNKPVRAFPGGILQRLHHAGINDIGYLLRNVAQASPQPEHPDLRHYLPHRLTEPLFRQREIRRRQIMAGILNREVHVRPRAGQ